MTSKGDDEDTAINDEDDGSVVKEERETTDKDCNKGKKSFTDFYRLIIPYNL